MAAGAWQPWALLPALSQGGSAFQTAGRSLILWKVCVHMLSDMENQLSSPIFLIQLSPWYSQIQHAGNGSYFRKLQFPSSIPNTLEKYQGANLTGSNRQNRSSGEQEILKYSIEKDLLKLDEK